MIVSMNRQSKCSHEVILLEGVEHGEEMILLLFVVEHVMVAVPLACSFFTFSHDKRLHRQRTSHASHQAHHCCSGGHTTVLVPG